jgi:hypothetical protein
MSSRHEVDDKRYNQNKKSLSYMRRGPSYLPDESLYTIYRSRVLWQRRFRGISIPIHYLNCSVCFALWEGFLHHGPGNRVAVLGKGLAHALHGDVRRFGTIHTEANDNQRELKNKKY